MSLSIADVLDLFASRGARMYGSEAVSQTEHALQCATLAAREGASAQLVAACFLHDVGHLVAERPHGLEHESDDVHQYLAIPFLRGSFPDAVLEPIRLHVDAKRYLCRVDRSYWGTLSPASQHSLKLQGGAFDPVAADAFIAQAHARDAIRLRRWDDLAKVPGCATLTLGEVEAVLRSAAVVSTSESVVNA